jgi:hypothetical protein
MIKKDWNFSDELEQVKDEQSSSVDVMLLRELNVTASEMLDCTSYEPLFRRVFDAKELDTPMRQFADRTLRAIEGEKGRRQAAFRDAGRR